MDKTNEKILTVSFLVAGILAGVVTAFLLDAFSGAFGIVAKATDSTVVRHGLPVVLAFSVFFLLRFNKSVMAWGDEVVLEIRKVVWPSAKDTRGMTIVVIVMVLISSVIITTFDFLSGTAITYIRRIFN